MALWVFSLKTDKLFKAKNVLGSVHSICLIGGMTYNVKNMQLHYVNLI